jgi:hypothetical protein
MIALTLTNLLLVIANAYVAYLNYQVKNYKSSLVSTFSCGFILAFLIAYIIS